MRSHHGMVDMFGMPSKRFDTKDGLPSVLPPLGARPLASYLATDLPKMNLSDLSQNLQRNLAAYKRKIAEALDARELQKDDVVCLALDRAEGKVFKQQWFQLRGSLHACMHAWMTLCKLQAIEHSACK